MSRPTLQALALALAFLAAARPGQAADLAGIWTNEEQVRFAAEAGKPAPPWTGFRLEPDGYGWKGVPVDPFGRATGPARGFSSAETAGGLRLPGLDMRKARPFRCWAAVPRKGTEPLQWWFQQDVRLHDQGGRAELQTDEPVPQRFMLTMRNVVWPSGPNQPSLVLYVLTPEGGERAVAYSWADPAARRVGINIRSIQASCSLAP